MRLASAAALCLLFAPPALAAATDWQEMAPGMRARMISADTLSDGKTLVGIELDMPQGTKTYWRVPGETGLPASLDLSRSAGIAGHALFWPMPERERVGGYLDYVYRGHVVLPLSVTLAGPALLAADVTLGVCSDICVPASATFTLPLAFEKPDPGNGLRLAQAMAEVPLAWSGATSLVGEARYEPGQGLWLAIDPTGLDPLSLIADLGVEGPLFGAPQKSRDADLVLFPVVGSKGKEELVGKIVTITFKTPQGSFEMMREIAAPQSTGERPAARKS